MNTLEQMTGRFEKMPIDIQEAIKAFDYDHRLQKIHKKHKLHLDQSVLLESILADIVFGDMKSTELTTQVTDKLRIDRSVGAEIAIEINSEIILPLREKIKEVQEAENNI